jgi:hypothetical protein
MKKLILALTLAAACVQASADVVTIGATGSGWCTSGYCNNTNVSTLDNNDISQSINNWQSFTLDSGTIAGATLSLYESSSYSSFYTYGTGEINFYIASAITYDGLQNGPSIGKIANGSSQSTGAYVHIALNDYGIAQLNSLQGKSFVIGGSNGHSTVDAFGFSGYNTPAPYLTLDVGTAAPSAVPEPGSIALLGLGIAGLMTARRKKQVK